MDNSEFDMVMKSIDETNARIDKLSERLRRAANNPAPTVPIYDPGNFPQDAVEGQTAVGIDGHLWYYLNGSWLSTTPPVPVVPPLHFITVNTSQDIASDVLVATDYSISGGFTNDISGSFQTFVNQPINGIYFDLNPTSNYLKIKSAGIYLFQFGFIDNGASPDLGTFDIFFQVNVSRLRRSRKVNHTLGTNTDMLSGDNGIYIAHQSEIYPSNTNIYIGQNSGYTLTKNGTGSGPGGSLSWGVSISIVRLSGF